MTRRTKIDVFPKVVQRLGQVRSVFLGCLSKCIANRNAVLFPIPGNWAISLTAFSNLHVVNLE